MFHSPAEGSVYMETEGSQGHESFCFHFTARVKCVCCLLLRRGLRRSRFAGWAAFICTLFFWSENIFHSAVQHEAIK